MVLVDPHEAMLELQDNLREHADFKGLSISPRAGDRFAVRVKEVEELGGETIDFMASGPNDLPDSITGETSKEATEQDDAVETTDEITGVAHAARVLRDRLGISSGTPTPIEELGSDGMGEIEDVATQVDSADTSDLLRQLNIEGYGMEVDWDGHVRDPNNPDEEPPAVEPDTSDDSSDSSNRKLAIAAAAIGVGAMLLGGGSS